MRIGLGIRGADECVEVNHRVCVRGYIGVFHPRYSGVMRVIYRPLKSVIWGVFSPRMNYVLGV